MTAYMQEMLDKSHADGVALGIGRGEERSLTASIRSLMETLHLTAEQAMDALRVPQKDRAKYAALLS